MATIYLIRHGQASFGADDYDALSELGHEQAIVAGEALFKKGLPQRILAGTMLRHFQTYDGATKDSAASLPELEKVEGWNEYDHQAVLGALDERLATPASMKAYMREFPDPKKAFAKMYQEAIARWASGEHDVDYAESWSQFQQRVSDAFANLGASLGAKESAWVFTSGGPISVILQPLLQLPQRNILKLNWTLVNAGFSKVVITPNKTFLATLNEHSHFEAPDKQAMITYK